MKITLSNIHLDPDNAARFSASVMIDGKRIGTIGNAGHGLPDTYAGNLMTLGELDEVLAEHFPRMQTADGASHDACLSLVVAMLLEQHRESTRGGLISPEDRAELRRIVAQARSNAQGFCDGLDICNTVEALDASRLHRARELIDAASRLLKKMKAP